MKLNHKFPQRTRFRAAELRRMRRQMRLLEATFPALVRVAVRQLLERLEGDSEWAEIETRRMIDEDAEDFDGRRRGGLIRAADARG